MTSKPSQHAAWWWSTGKNRRATALLLVAVLSMTAGAGVMIEQFADAPELAVTGYTDTIPASSTPYMPLGLVLFFAPIAAWTVFAMWSYRRSDRTR